MPGFTPLFDGKVGDLKLRPATWQPTRSVIDWGIGPGGCTSCRTANAYGDYTLRVDFRLPCMSDSGVFIKGGIQVNIWDFSVGSGQLHALRLPPGPKGEKQSSDPSSRQDRPVGEWNTMLIEFSKKNHVRVVLNAIEVMNAWLPEIQPPYEQSISLQYHNEPLEFKSLYIRPAVGGN
jgi:hypothetical protein